VARARLGTASLDFLGVLVQEPHEDWEALEVREPRVGSRLSELRVRTAGMGQTGPTVRPVHFRPTMELSGRPTGCRPMDSTEVMET
jgi:hypothetical protein